MNLKEYSKMVKEVINKKISTETFSKINELPMGASSQNFGFILRDKTVLVKSSLKSLSVAFEIANRMVQNRDYTLSLKVSSDSKSKTVSKTFSSETNVEKARKELEASAEADRVFYEIITTDDFEITSSEYEGIVVKFKDETLARRFLQLLTGLFPFVETEQNSKKVEIICELNIEKYEQFKKEQTKKGTLRCSVKIDDNAMGAKSGTFIF